MMTAAPSMMVMYSREIAVLHASLSLANKITPGGLENLSLDDAISLKVVGIIVDAIEEVCSGLECKRSEQEYDDWGYNVTAILTHLLLHSEPLPTDETMWQLSQDSKGILKLMSLLVKYWTVIKIMALLENCSMMIIMMWCPEMSAYDAVVVGMPRISLSLYYSVLSRRACYIHLIKLLNSMENDDGHRLLQDLIMFSKSTASSELKFSIITTMLEYLCLMKNPYSAQEPKYTLQLVEAIKDVVSSDTLVHGLVCSRCLVCLMNLLRGLVTGSMLALDLPDRQLNSNIDTQVLSSQGSALDLFDVERDLPWIQCVLSSSELPLLHSVLVTLNKMLHITQSDNISVDNGANTNSQNCVSHILNDNVSMPGGSDDELVRYLIDTDAQNSPFLSRMLPPRAEKAVMRKFFMSSLTCLRECHSHENSHETTCDISPLLSQLLSRLRNVEELIQTYNITEALEKEKIPVKFERALHVISHRLRGHEDMAAWMSSVSNLTVCHDSRWIACIKSYTVEFATLCNVSHLWRTLCDLPVNSDVKTPLSQVLLDLISKLSMEEKNEMIRVIHCPVTSVMRESSSRENLEQEITSSFNKLVLHEGLLVSEKEMSDLTSLCLLLPEDFLKKLVHSAITNKAQTAVMTQVLQCMPGLCAVHHHNHAPFILECYLREVKQGLTGKQLSNARAFSSGLLSRPPSPAGGHSSLVPHSDFLAQCVFPLFSQTEVDWMRIELCLALLDIAVETLTHLNPDWPLLRECSMLPLLVYLCQVIHRCERLVGGAEGGASTCDVEEKVAVKVAVKEESTRVVTGVVALLLPCQTDIDDEDIFWLRDTLIEIDVLLLCYVSPLIPSFTERVSQLIPKCLLSNTCDSNMTSQEYYRMLSIAKRSCGSVRFIESLPGWSRLRHNDRALPVVTLALVQVLVNATSTEWVNIHTFINILIQKEIIVVPANSYPSAVSSCSIMQQALLVITNHLGISHQVLNQLLLAYINMVKVTCLGDGSKLSTESRTLLLRELVQLQNSLPHHMYDSVEVLTLDILTSLNTPQQTTPADRQLTETIVSKVKKPQARDLYLKTLKV